METRLLIVALAAAFALTACGGSSDSARNDDSGAAGRPSPAPSASTAPKKDLGDGKSNPLVEPTSSPSTMNEVGERLGLNLVKKAVIVEATKKVKKYPDTQEGQAALTEAAARGCVALKRSGGGEAAKDAVRKWAKAEDLEGDDAQTVFVTAIVSVCPEAETLLPQG